MWAKFLSMCICVGFSAVAGASSFIAQPFSEALDQAQLIVRGHTLKQNSDWAAGVDGTQRLYTFFDVSISEVLKGSWNENTLTFRQIGGEKDGKGMQVSGTASFRNDEDVIFLLNVANDSTPPVISLQGMMLGKVGIQRGPDGQERLVGMALEVDDEQKRVWTTKSLKAYLNESNRPLPGASPVGTPTVSVVGAGGGLATQGGTAVGPQGSLEPESSVQPAEVQPWHKRTVVLVIGILVALFAFWLVFRRKVK